MQKQYVQNFTNTGIQKCDKSELDTLKCYEQSTQVMPFSTRLLIFFFQHFSFNLRIFQFSMCSDSVPSREWPASSYDSGPRNHLQ